MCDLKECGSFSFFIEKFFKKAKVSNLTADKYYVSKNVTHYPLCYIFYFQYSYTVLYFLNYSTLTDNPSNKKSHIANIKIIFTIWLFSVSLLYTFHAAMLLHNTNQECNKYFFSKICYFTQNYITV